MQRHLDISLEGLIQKELRSLGVLFELHDPDDESIKQSWKVVNFGYNERREKHTRSEGCPLFSKSIVSLYVARRMVTFAMRAGD